MRESLRVRLGVAFILIAWTGIAAAAPALWKASDEDSEVWLFGSVHLLQADTRWKSPALEHALDAADLFYYEAPLNQGAQAKIAALVGRHGLNSGGKKLTDYLAQSETALLTRVAGDLGLPLARLQPLKPWLASITLQLVMLRQSGYSASSGVEMSLEPLTPDARERYFETAEQQIRFFIDLDREAATDALVGTLHQIEEQPRLLDKMVAAWASGDVQALGSLFHDAMKETGPEVYRVLIVNRNKAWVEEIRTRMAGDEDILIVVGAGHLVGESSVPRLLEAEGIAVERIQ